MGGTKKDDSSESEEEEEDVGDGSEYMRCNCGEKGGSVSWRPVSERELSSLKESRELSSSEWEDVASGEDKASGDDSLSGEELWLEVDSKDSRDGDKEGDAIGKVGAEPLMGSEVGLGRRGDPSGLGARFRILFDWRLGAASLDRWWWGR